MDARNLPAMNCGRALSAAEMTAVKAHCRHWTARMDSFVKLAPAPRWQPDMTVDAAMHTHYNRFLPAADFLHTLTSLLLACLPDATWLPRPIASQDFRSLIDFWQLLPDEWSHRVAWENSEELLALACSLAAPARFGTRLDRYPEQLELLPSEPPALVLDLACGTGQWTWQLANHLPPETRILGVTLEPLEAWMAAARQMPHLDMIRRPIPFPVIEPTAAVPVFVAADVRNFAVSAPADLIFCNGLAGGPAFSSNADLHALWATINRCSHNGSQLVIANHFHAGYRNANESTAVAAPPDWQVTGRSGSSIVMHRIPHSTAGTRKA